MTNHAHDDEPNGSEIAIIGMACRFPGAHDPDTFWANLRDGVESIARLSNDELRASGVDPAEYTNPSYVKAAPILNDVEFFDPAFFGYSPLEAEIMDPQQRIFLECAWESLEYAGYNPETYKHPIGVFAGSRTNTYVFNVVSNQALFKSLGVFQVSIGNDLASLATGVSYKLNLRGPSYAVHTACSTALVAVHLACQSLLIDECRMALAGGVAVNVPHRVGYLYDQGGILSPDGHCRAFDAQAQGTIFGSGAGVVVLKRLEDALADSDTIHAIIKGSATNNDGSVKATFTAPSVEGQARVILDALTTAEVTPESISYVEAHATGTPLGDPIEVRALTKAFRTGTAKNGFCAVGSVKANVGHLDAAAGMPALIKTVLALKHRQIPPTPHFEAPNPKIDFANSPFYVNAALAPWTTNGAPRRKGISSFGFGGTNAHLILEEAGEPEPTDPSRPWQLLVVSARSAAALEQATDNLARQLRQHPDSDLADVAYTLQVGRKAFSYRRTLVCNDRDSAIAALESRDPQRLLTDTPPSGDRPVVFMFGGQGAQYVNMARTLYDEAPLFRTTVDHCCDILTPHLGRDLRAVLFPPDQQREAAVELLNQTAFAQPALFVIEYALAQLWMSWGIQPQALIGHSLGEYVAACLADVLLLEDALMLVAARGRLMQQLPAGAMLAIPLPEDEIYPLLSPELSLAAINGPSQCVVSGPSVAIEALEQRLAEQELRSRRLHTSHAFHSAMMDPILAEFTALVRTIKLNPPRRSYISNLTGTWMTPEDATDPEYWARHLRQAVRFAAGIAELASDSSRVLLEVGPGTTLSTFARLQHNAQSVVASLRHPSDRRTDWEILLTAVGRLWLAGVRIDWPGVWGEEQRRRIPLPTYPFERQRYWIDPAQLAAPMSNRSTGPDKKPDIDDWFYVPVWKQVHLPAAPEPAVETERAERWLIFCDAWGAGARIAAYLQQHGRNVITVHSGERFDQMHEGAFVVDPYKRDDVDRLISELCARNQAPEKILYLWSMTASPAARSELLGKEETFYLNFCSLLFLAQAIGKQAMAATQLTVLSNNLQSVLRDEALNPEQALIVGPCKVIPKEYPGIACHSIDIDTQASNAFEDQAAIEQLIKECASQADEPFVAYRGANRWVQTFEPTRIEGSIPRTRLRERGVYLITGGLGGIGLTLAQYLAQAVHARLVLIGRSRLPERSEWSQWLTNHGEDDEISIKIRKVQVIEDTGGEVLVCSADVTNQEQMRSVVEQANAHFGGIHGVIHAAGLAGGGMIQLKTPEAAKKVIEPKLRGLHVIESVLQHTQADFIVLCSSIGSILGEFGQVDYCAANAFLDAFAQYKHATGDQTIISINWDDWQDVGISVTTEVPPELKEWRAGILQKGISTPEGVEVFQRLLSYNLPQVVVSTRDLQARIEAVHTFTSDQIQQGIVNIGASDSTTVSQPSNQLSTVSRGELERTVANIWQKVLGVPHVGIHDNFFDLGGNSLSGMQLLSEIKRVLNVQLAPVALFAAPTVSAIAKLLSPNEAVVTSAAASKAPSSDASPAIAIIGMAGRFPGANSVETFWQNLRDGVESITFFSDDELRAAGVPESLLSDPNYVKARPILEDVAGFDAPFFGYSPREAELMDPQHRLFLECAWHALEHAGYDSERYAGAIAVYGGASLSTYLLNLYARADLMTSIDPLQAVIGNDKDSLTTGVSYKLNLTGPSMAVQTFCSTSLVAVHLGCQSLMRGECDMALAGGVTVLVPQTSGYRYQEDGILSPDGHSRTFDAQARGTLFGNGVGIVVLKRLDDALADGDYIHAVIKGSAINNDGSMKVGYTAPSIDGQAAVITAAHRAAGINPETIQYVEAHGTATALGDPIEIAALTKAFRAATQSTEFCAIGSLKTNIGHLDRAAGIAALIKTTLALKHRHIPPSLHFEAPNPKIDFPNSPFYVNATLQAWETHGAPRRAGVSSLGFGGTNAHVIVEEAPPVVASGPARSSQLLALSAKTSAALDQATANLAAYLRNDPEANLADVAYTLQVGRRAFRHRRVVICHDRDDALAALESRDPQRVLTDAQETHQRPIVFMFSGQGSQYVDMARELYDHEPTFREHVDQCCELLMPHLGADLREVLYPENREPRTENQQATADGGQRTADEGQRAPEDGGTTADERTTHDARRTTHDDNRLEQTQYAQPALFVIEYALAQLWMSWGIQPHALIGHSIGEYVAACLAGVMRLEDALKVVAARGRLMQSLPTGAMLAVSLPEDEAQAFLREDISLAAVNGPAQCVLSGHHDAIDALEQQLAARSVQCRRLHTSHAFHSAMMAPILEPFAALIQEIHLSPPQAPILSNLTGTWMTSEQATDPTYWARHLREPVRFFDGLTVLTSDSERLFLEVGPGQTLATLARRLRHSAHEPIAMASLRHPNDHQSDVASMLTTLGRIWLTGAPVDWAGFAAHERRLRVPLPTYPFEHQRYWIDADLGALTNGAGARLKDAHADGISRCYLPSWKRTLPPRQVRLTDLAATPERWLVFIDAAGVGARLNALLTQANHSIHIVHIGEQFERVGDGQYSLNPKRWNDYHALLNEMERQGGLPGRIIHLWGVSAEATNDLASTSDVGFSSLVCLAQALGKRVLSESLQLWVVANDLHEVNGAETIHPAKAAILGPCAAITYEYPQITCRCIDIALAHGDIDKATGHIIAEIAAEASEWLVAYRGNHRWLPTVERIEAAETTKGAQSGAMFKPNGVYLVANGLTSDSVQFVAHLAQEQHARLALIEAEPLPDRSEWSQLLPAESVPLSAQYIAIAPYTNGGAPPQWPAWDLKDEQAYSDRLARQIEEQHPVEHLPGELEHLSNVLCSSYICNYLRANDVVIQADVTYHKEQLKNQLRIAPKFTKLYEFMLAALAEDGIIALEDNVITFLKNAQAIKDAELLRETLRQRSPESEEGFQALEHCVHHYPQALAGEIDAISVLYPDGNSRMMRAIETNQLRFSNLRRCRALLVETLAHLAAKTPHRTLRILEIGAGDGNLTWDAAHKLKNQRVEYYVTDISRSFVLNAEKQAIREHIDFMRFGVLDISKNPADQDYERYSFDIIIASEVLHATHDIAEALDQVSKLLAPNGIVCILEATKAQRWASMVWGLLDGWWSFTDEQLRRHSPLLSADSWRDLLSAKTFHAVDVYPHQDEQHGADYALIIAQQQSPVPSQDYQDWIGEVHHHEQQRIQRKLQQIQQLEAYGAEVLMINANLIDADQMRLAVARTHGHFGAIHGVVVAHEFADEAETHAGESSQRAGYETHITPALQRLSALTHALQNQPLDVTLIVAAVRPALRELRSVAHSATDHVLQAFATGSRASHGPQWTYVRWDRWEPDSAPTHDQFHALAQLGTLEYTPQALVSSQRLDIDVEYRNSILALRKPADPQPDVMIARHPRPHLANVYVAPRNETEQLVANIWEDILGLQRS
jgi:acyl transferase domain-containing protein/SAM-dependent methyltransferase